MLLSEQNREKRKKLQDDWNTWNKKWNQMHEEDKTEREILRDGEASDEEEDTMPKKSK